MKEAKVRAFHPVLFWFKLRNSLIFCRLDKSFPCHYLKFISLLTFRLVFRVSTFQSLLAQLEIYLLWNPSERTRSWRFWILLPGWRDDTESSPHCKSESRRRMSGRPEVPQSLQRIARCLPNFWLKLKLKTFFPTKTSNRFVKTQKVITVINHLKFL